MNVVHGRHFTGCSHSQPAPRRNAVPHHKYTAMHRPQLKKVLTACLATYHSACALHPTYTHKPPFNIQVHMFLTHARSEQHTKGHLAGRPHPTDDRPDEPGVLVQLKGAVADSPPAVQAAAPVPDHAVAAAPDRLQHEQHSKFGAIACEGAAAAWRRYSLTW